MTTTYLGLTLPTVSVTLGPLWATEVNAALTTIDSHDHSSGKGQQVPTSGLAINADLTFATYRAINVKSIKYTLQGSTLTGSNNANSTYSVNGDLYFTNNSGSAVQITSGGSIISSAGAMQTVEINAVSSNITISPASSYVYLTVDTTAARTITLPLASAVSSGRVYIIKDVSGSSNTYNITLARQGSDLIDGATSATLDSNYASWWVVGDASSNWYVS